MREATQASIAAKLGHEGVEADFADNLLGDESTIIVAEQMEQNKTKRMLDLRGNNIRSAGLKAVANMLQVNHTLNTLVLEWNGLGMYDLGIRALATSLEVNSTLTQLDLRNNRISPQGGTAIANALKKNHALGYLDLRWNEVGVEGGNGFIMALRVNRNMQECLLSGNNLSKTQMDEVAILLAGSAGATNNTTSSKAPPPPPGAGDGSSGQLVVSAKNNHSSDSRHSHNMQAEYVASEILLAEETKTREQKLHVSPFNF
jgi:hypothetical protein